MNPALFLIATLCLAQDAPSGDILETLPHASTIEAKRVVEPTHYVIHILDWHFVPEDKFIADLRDQGVTEDLEAKYAKHLDDVEVIQAEQKALLTALVEHHGVTEVYAEGLTEQEMPTYTARLNKLRSLGRKLRLLRKAAADIDDANLKAKLEAADKPYRLEMLRIGAAGELHMQGVLKTRPAEDGKAHEAARPVDDDGKVKLDAELIEAREAAIVKNTLAGGPVTVLILGGAHDLSDKVPEGCQYIRVGTKAYELMAGQR